jgi:hypothetical protein
LGTSTLYRRIRDGKLVRIPQLPQDNDVERCVSPICASGLPASKSNNQSQIRRLLYYFALNALTTPIAQKRIP